LKFGFLDTSINTQIIDIHQSLDTLRKDVRHGHDSDIDNAVKVLDIEVYSRRTLTQELFNEFVTLHHKAAGRVTRPRKTFDVMFDAVKKDQAFLTMARKNAQVVGCSYFHSYKENVYYGSSCNAPEVRGIPVSHAIQWVSIEYMKKRRASHFYEIGWQQYDTTLTDFPSKKEIDIARFKRGFGGFTVPLFRGEKFYDKKFFLSTYQERVKNFYEKVF